MSIPENMKEITDLASQLVNPILPQMEDFVTFDLAKKLKEKGFPIKTKTEGKFGLTKVKEVEILPTISQVLKWLREEKNMFIEMFLYNGKYSYLVKSVTQICEDDLFHECLSEDTANEEYDTYEEAALAGIEYCLYNLI